MSKEEQEKIDYLIDDIDDETGKVMEKHNMHTRFDRGVSPDKISRLCYKDKDDALAVVEYAYQNFLNKVGKENVENQPEMYYMRGLEKFFEYVSDLEKNKLALQGKIGKLALDTDINQKEEAGRRVQNDMKTQNKNITK